MIITTYSTQRVLLKAPPVLSSIVLATFVAELLSFGGQWKPASSTVVFGGHLYHLHYQRYAELSALLKPLTQHFRPQFLPALVTTASSPRLTSGHAANLGADAGTMKVKRQSNPVRLQEKVAKPSKAIPTLGTPASTAANERSATIVAGTDTQHRHVHNFSHESGDNGQGLKSSKPQQSLTLNLISNAEGPLGS